MNAVSLLSFTGLIYPFYSVCYEGTRCCQHGTGELPFLPCGLQSGTLSSATAGVFLIFTRDKALERGC